MNRYAGQPLLRLLECYVLDAIGQLHDEHRKNLERMVPKLTEVWGFDGTWNEIISAEMDFPETLPDRIREIWQANLDRLHPAGVAIDPEEFAMQFVDENFLDSPT